jgi:DNA-binding transcriptional regulator YiaG
MNKIEFTATLNKIGLSKRQFSELSNTPYNTVNNWNDENRPVPSWIESWLENYIKAKDIEKIAEAVKPYIK